MESVLLDAAGHRRSPATMPGYHQGRAPRNKGLRYQGEESLIVTGDCNGHHAKRCGQCFSLLYWTGYEGRIRVPYGSLVDEPNLKPTAHMFVGSKAPWYEILDDLPQHDEYPWTDD
jgi:hypothetical protein